MKIKKFEGKNKFRNNKQIKQSKGGVVKTKFKQKIKQNNGLKNAITATKKREKNGFKGSKFRAKRTSKSSSVDEADSEEDPEPVINDDSENEDEIPDRDPEGEKEDDSGDESEEINFLDKEENDSEDEGDSQDDNESDAEKAEDEAEKHKKSLEKLKETDPEFYKFLQQNDKSLLEFNLSDDDLSDDEREIKAEAVHKPAEADLEVASDESDFEDEDKVESKGAVTLKMLKSWQASIKTDKSNKTIITVMKAFNACLRRVSTEETEEHSEFKVEGSAVFNAVIQLCVLELGPAVRRFLGLAQGSKLPPHKCKKFPKIRGPLKSYFTDLLKLLTGVSSSNIQTVLLKHLHYMSSLLVSFPNITKSILKRIISFWGTAEDGVRVVAFFCILRITNNHLVGLLDLVLKTMYLTYVRNSKFVSLNNLASINFMRRSLVEMFAVDTDVSYQHVFLYVRQLAIHLRNAVTVNKKENLQAVYNWQFVNSLKLWGCLLSVACHDRKPQMQQLVYPFVQVCLGALKLVPTPQYYPLRFHICQILIDFSRETDVFVPILPFLLEVLNTYDFNKKHLKVSMKPLHFTTVLRLSKSQLSENGFKDAVIENLYQLLLEYLTSKSHSVAFPDLSLVCVVQLKQFLKKCANSNYNRKMKQLLEKIEQNSEMIETERNKLNVHLKDFRQIEAWESRIRNKGTPLSSYFDSWSKVHSVKKNKRLTQNDKLGDYKLPVLKKRDRSAVKSEEGRENDGPVELFPSDSEEDETLLDKEGAGKRKCKRGKRGGRNVNKKLKAEEEVEEETDFKEDIVENINLNDW